MNDEMKRLTEIPSIVKYIQFNYEDYQKDMDEVTVELRLFKEKTAKLVEALKAIATTGCADDRAIAATALAEFEAGKLDEMSHSRTHRDDVSKKSTFCDITGYEVPSVRNDPRDIHDD